MTQQAPLTWQQRWLWRQMQRHADWNCVSVSAFRLKGPLDIECLQTNVAEVIRRHGSLRTRVVSVDEVANQHIDEPQDYTLERIQIDGASQPAIDANAVRWVEEFCDLKIHAATGPLLNVRLLKLADREHWLVFALHRLIGDCSTIDQVFREIWALYDQSVEGRPSAFATRPAQYADYAIWQQQTGDEWLKRHEAYWKTRLAGAAPLRWPVDECAAGAPRGALAKMNIWLGAALSTQLQELSRRLRTLSATVMFAIYAAVMWRWCGQRDFVVPFNVAGRQSEHKSVIGYFSHMVYLRIAISGNETFSELLSAVSNEFFRALLHQDFGRMATERPELYAGTFFQWITWHHNDASETTVERVPVRDFGEGLTVIPPGNVDVEVTFFDTKDGIYAAGMYRADLFTADTMERFMSDLRLATEQFVRDPNVRLAMASARD